MSSKYEITDNYTSINIVALSTDNASAVELLKKCFPGLNCSSDCSSCSYKFLDEVNLKLFTKYPGDDLLKPFPEFLDFLLISVPEGHELESEILDYANTKSEARARLLVDGGDRTLPSTVVSANVDDLTNYFKEFFMIIKQIGGTDPEKVFAARMGYPSKSFFSKVAKFNVKLIPKLENMMKSFENFDSNRGYSENNLKFDFSPISEESNGLGLKLNIFAGEAFDENNKNLPLSVRDNPITGAIELQAKSPEHADEVIDFLKNIYEMLENMGILEILKKTVNFSVSFSKEGSSVFIDFTTGGQLGESLIHRIRSLNFSKFNYSFSDVIRVQTNLNVSEVWKNPDLDNIINKLSTFTVQGEGKLLNFRTIFHFIKEWCVYGKNDGDKKSTHLLSASLLILSCFESLGFELKYDSKDLKGNVMELLDDYLDGEGSSQAFIGMGNEQWANALLPMGLSMIQSIAPMISSLGNLSAINFDKISLEILSPVARVEFKLDLLLPGLTEFIAENITQ